MSEDLTALREFCQSETQREQLEAVIASGSVNAAAKATGLGRSTLRGTMHRIRNNAALKGYAPQHDMTRPTADPFYVKGTSTLYNDKGEISAQWVKTAIDQNERQRLLVEALRESFEDFHGKSRKVKAPKRVEEDLLSVYPMGDPHIGMYAWADEAGEDFDCTIASKQLRAAIHDLVDRGPRSQVGLLLNLGDFFHGDNRNNRTPQSGHALDIDTRHPKVLRVGVDLMIEGVYAALSRHEKVIVRNNMGNHDGESSVALTVAMAKYFHGDPRVVIDDSPAHFWFHRFGKVLIGSTHGDTAKPADLPGIMAASRPEDWGQTEHRYWYTGHIHSKNAMEFPGCVWESFRTLAAKDAWHASMGYMAGRDMQCIVHHRETGEEERHLFNISKFRRLEC